MSMLQSSLRIERNHTEIEEMLNQAIYRVAYALKGEVDRKKILLKSPIQEAFRCDTRMPLATISAARYTTATQTNSGCYCSTLSTFGVQNSEEATTWELSGKIDSELEHALMTSNIRTELISRRCLHCLSGRCSRYVQLNGVC